MKRLVSSLILVPVAATAGGAQTAAPTLLQKPAANQSHVVFVYAGDLWTLPRAGGEAEHLTSGVGTETDPAISPDGRWIALTGEYDGNVDVYLVPVSGGVPNV